MAKRLEQNQKLIQEDTGILELVASQQQERLHGEGLIHQHTANALELRSPNVLCLDGVVMVRVKVGNDGKLVADPLARQMTLVVVNFAPKGYDPEHRPMSVAERVRRFAGVVATPDFGIGGGVSVGIWRGVGVNLGAAVLFVPSLSGSE